MISDHSLRYCTRKIPKAKYDRQKEITFHSLKNYLPKGPWREFHFLTMKTLIILDVTYSDFSTKLDCVINTIYYTVLLRQSESKTRQVSDLMEKLQRKYTPETNSIKKFKSTKLHANEEIYKEVQNTVQNLIRKKKKAYFVWENMAQILKNFIQKTLKQLARSSKKRLPCTDVCLPKSIRFDI